ncbi:sigma factor-like helix-turn-helix DNA-binding protein [Sphingomonas sp. PP-CE-1G-424]|uniref:sigma factor-like helix-turn-helix DNA-binding protein n=1 Tax=Sphingomonas sp. PP-CE-1G-424 TaxID=2135658 RepID=UPI001054E425|nr:sigma factor-like helix-turn-helix DNA-binding protein [Sphingomonas sp. PP-CE-1G-424]TCP66296.1 sigma-70-like protein [Sphingomonas sp. PP-CE-1G-424]
MNTLSPRQRDCLQLVWERQATSKEIAAELGISKSTVDGYIAEAVEALGARDRRAAAALAFGQTPRAASGGHMTRVVEVQNVVTPDASSTEGFLASRPWRSRSRPRNTLSLAQTLGWIAIIAIGSLAALSLAASIGSGLPSVARPVIHAVRTLTT